MYQVVQPRGSDPLSMLLYGLTLVPLAKSIRKATQQVVQPWYADDMAMAGPASTINTAVKLLMRYGPDCGYYPEPDKSLLVCVDSEDCSTCSQMLREYNFNVFCTPDTWVDSLGIRLI